MSADVGNAVVVLHLERSAYFDTDATGADVWRRLEFPVRVSALVDTLVGKYDVTREICQRDVLAFLQDAFDQDMVQMATDESASADSATQGR